MSAASTAEQLRDAIAGKAADVERLRAEQQRAQTEAATTDDTVHELARLRQQREQVQAQAFIDRVQPDLKAIDKAIAAAERAGADAAASRQGAAAAAKLLHPQVAAAEAELIELQAQLVESLQREALDRIADLRDRIVELGRLQMVELMAELHAHAWTWDILQARLTGLEDPQRSESLGAMHFVGGVRLPVIWPDGNIYHFEASSMVRDRSPDLIRQQREHLAALGIDQHGPALRPPKPATPRPPEQPRDVRIYVSSQPVPEIAVRETPAAEPADPSDDFRIGTARNSDAELGIFEPSTMGSRGEMRGQTRRPERATNPTPIEDRHPGSIAVEGVPARIGLPETDDIGLVHSEIR